MIEEKNKETMSDGTELSEKDGYYDIKNMPHLCGDSEMTCYISFIGFIANFSKIRFKLSSNYYFWL